MIDENVSHVNNFSTPCWKLYEKMHFWAPIAGKVCEDRFGRRSHEPKASGDDVNRLEELLARQRTTEAVE